MNYFKSLLLTAFALLAFAACDTDDLRDDVDNLKGRVESLEAQVTLLNDNMTAIKRLLEGGQTITELKNTDGTYTLKLSDGSTITLTQGSKGEVKYPEITVNAEGQWVVNGEVLMQNGVPVQAVGKTGNDGITPKFRITDEGSFWQVSYDNGTTWVDVLDENNEKVSAVSDGSGGGSGADSFFEEVGVDATGEFFVIKLKGKDEAISIPIVKELLCEIIEPETGMKNGYWEIGYGETVTTTVKVKGDDIITTAPAGWVVTVSDVDASTNIATLSITAPTKATAANTRATADNSSDVTVQVNKGANWAVAKIQVKVVETSYYESYQEGGNIEYNGVIINKALYGDATLIDENTEVKSISAAGVYFIKAGIEVNYTTEEAIDYLILIGDNPSEKAKCVLKSSYINVVGKDSKGIFIMNMVIDGSALNNYVCRITGSMPSLILNNNEIIINNGKNLIQCQDNNAEVTNNITVANNLIKFNSTADWAASRILNFTQGLACQEVTVDNNVIYPSSMDYTINGTIVCSTGKAISSKVTVSRNTIINFIPVSQSLVRGVVMGDVTFSNLLFLYDSKASRNATLLNVEKSEAFGSLSFTDIIRYNRGIVVNLNPFGGGTPAGQSNAPVPLSPADPFDGGTFDLANGIFIPSAEYSEYGASIN